MKKLIRIIAVLPLLLFQCKDQPDKPSITGITPATGKEGDPIVINGTFLGSTTAILFGAQQAVVVDPQGGQVQTQVPPNLPLGNVSVTVVNKGGTSNAFNFLVVPPPPEITTLSPLQAASGTELTITGKYFTTAAEVDFGTTKVTVLDSKTDTQITVKIPDGLPLGAIDISVVNPSGTSNTSSFTILGIPVVTDFEPTAGPAGTHVIVTGSNLADVTAVSFGDVPATFVISNATQIDAVVPPSAVNGKIKLVSPGGQAISVSDFTVYGAPTVTGFSPASGAVGTTVTITGQNFLIAGIKVYFTGGLSDRIIPLSSTEITATVPAGAGTGQISVQSPAGAASSVNSFTVIGAPTISSFTPDNGVPGASISITGSAFVNVSSVKFNGTEVGSGNFNVNSTSSITAKVPSGTSTGTVSVTTPSGTGTSTSSFTIIGLPVINSFAPTSAVVGTSVTITGSGFTQVSGVKFNTTAASNYTVNSATQITAVVPAGATTGKITVTNAAGPQSSASSFTVIQIPFISSITPTSGLTGSTLTIDGTSLSNAKVRFGTTDVTVLAANSDTEIQVVIPTNLSPGAVNVSVITAGGTSNTKTFTVNAPIPVPVITSLQPATSYKGFPIMILGSKLKGATAVNIGTVAATVLTDYDGSLIFSIPSTVSNGTYSVTVSNAGGPSAGLTLTIVTAPSGVGSPPGTTFVSAPPANYVNAVSNQWTHFLFTTFAPDGAPAGCDFYDANDATACGKYTLTKDGSGNITANLITFYHGTGGAKETFYGQYSATVPDPCIQKMILISTKDGHLDTETVDVTDFDFYGTGTCH